MWSMQKGNTRDWQFMLHWGTSYRIRYIWGEEMYYFSKQIQVAVFKQNNFKKHLVGLHETQGNPLENDKDLQNKSLPFADYKQFICWIFQLEQYFFEDFLVIQAMEVVSHFW